MRISLLFLVWGFPLHAADWPQYFGPNRDGKSTETGLARTWGADGPKQLWSADIGSGWSSPIVVKDRVFLFHRLENDEIVECRNTAGKLLWKQSSRARYTDDFNFDDGPRSTPCVVEDRLFTLGADGDLTAWELDGGKKLWSRNINKDYQVVKAFFGVGSSPIVVGDKLLLNVGAKGAGVVAFNAKTGEEVWKSGNDGVSYSSPVLADIAGTQLAVFFTREGLFAVNPKDGKEAYSYPWRPRLNASVNAASPIVVGDQIFISTSYSTGAVVLEASKGELKEIWKGDKSLSCHYNTPVVIKDHLYGIDGRQEGGRAQLRCVEWKTGKVQWTKEAFGCATLTSADGLLFAMNENGELVLIEPNPQGYKELGRSKILDGPIRAATALADGRLYARSGKKAVCVQVGK